MYLELGSHNSLRPGSNPYEVITEIIKSKLFPGSLPIGYPILISLGVWRFLIILLCIAVILTPNYLKKEKDQAGVYWIYRKVYINGMNHTPYYVPNHLMVYAGTEILTSLAFLTFTILCYLANKSPSFEMTSYVELWYELVWIPACLSVWIAGWGYFYVCVCSPETKRSGFRAHIYHPVFLNSLCLSWIVILLVGAIFWVSKTFIGLRSLYSEYGKAILTLKQDSTEWEKNPSSFNLKGFLTFKKFQPLAEEGRKVIQIFKACSIWWLIMAALLALFHLAAIISLMRMMKSTLKTDEASTPSVFDEPQSMKKKWTNKELSQGYRTLVLHCILIATAQLLCVGVALAFYFGVNRFSQAGWRTAAPVIEMIPTSIVTPALLIHKLLEMIDKKKTPVVSFSQISCPTLPSFAGRLSTENNSGPTRVENNLLRKDTEKSESEKSERNCGSVKTKSASNSCTTSLSENLV